MAKITSNIMKVGVHCYVPIAKINLRSNAKLFCMVLLRLGLKGVKYFGTSQNLACTLVYQMGIRIYDQISIIRNCLKVKLRHAFSLGFGLKVVKIAWNVAKVGVHACSTNEHPNL